MFYHSFLHKRNEIYHLYTTVFLCFLSGFLYACSMNPLSQSMRCLVKQTVTISITQLSSMKDVTAMLMIANRIRLLTWGKYLTAHQTLPFLSILSLCRQQQLRGWGAWPADIELAQSAKSKAHCRSSLLQLLQWKKKSANVLRTSLNPQHPESWALDWRPLEPFSAPLLPSLIDLNCHPSLLVTSVRRLIYGGSWVQMISLPSPAPVFLVSWLLMTTLKRA